MMGPARRTTDERAVVATLVLVATEAVLYVRDLETMAEFYRQCLGLAVIESGERYCGFRADSLVLWLVRGQRPKVDGGGGDSPTVRRSRVPVKLGFEVSSVEQAGATIVASGCWVRPTSWEFAGYRRRDAADPEGNIITLLEPLSTTE
jgi:predicted enzyme related to lactoylglutathione lyase